MADGEAPAEDAGAPAPAADVDAVPDGDALADEGAAPAEGGEAPAEPEAGEAEAAADGGGEADGGALDGDLDAAAEQAEPPEAVLEGEAPEDPGFDDPDGGVLEDEGDDRFDEDFDTEQGRDMLQGEVGDDPGEGEAQIAEDELDELDELEPNNPLYQRIRAALSKQLEEQQTRLTVDLREREENFKRLKKKKEDVGVELYGVQQQLARMQLILEKTHDNFNMVRKMREQAEDETRSVFKEYEKKKAELAAQQKRMNTFQAELDKLNATLQQVEQYNDQMKGEIAITRRATYKAEEHVQELEGQKKQQDLLLDDLTRSIKALEAKLDMYTAQLEAQKTETGQAQQVLDEANAEMDKIRAEKKQLLQQWNSSLLAVRRRDEHLQGVEKALREAQQQELAVMGEISSLKTSIRKEQDSNENVASMLMKVRNSAAFLERQLDAVREQKQRLQEQFAVLKRSLEQSDAELAQVEMDKKQTVEQTAKVEKLLVSTMNETHKMEEGVLQSLAEQTTLQKSAQSTDKITQEMQKQMHGKENELAQVRNELARIKVDALNTLAHNDQLKTTVTDIDAELKRKEQLVGKYEVEIRRRNDEVEKKMRDLDSLNRKFESLKAKLDMQAGAEAEAAGPLEATIKSLRTEIDAKRKVCNDLQRMWMSTQTELVKLSNEAAVQSEKVGEVKSQVAVLTQKRVRVEGQIKVQEKEGGELRKSIGALHTDMAKLNELIGVNQKSVAVLEGDNFTLETDMANTLKDLEEEAVRLENQVRATLAHKERVKEELVEKERVIMVLERKMELEKEMQAAYVHKDDGSDVVAGMKREIHRMQLRYSQLMRRQEELMVEMERAIFKRDSISVRGKLQQKAKGAPTGAGTKGDLRRMVQELSKRTQDLEGEIARHDKDIKELDVQQKELGMRMDESGVAIREAQTHDEDILQEMHQMDVDKQRLKAQIYALHKTAKLYTALERGQYAAPDPAEVEEGLANAQARAEQLAQVSQQLSAMDPRLAASIAAIPAALPTQ